jgi:anti-sigma regulatory factor (Ser/Thr protein kinase)
VQPNQHVLRFPGTLAGFSEAFVGLRSFLDAQHLNGRPRYNVELVFDEIVANIIRHGIPGAHVEVAVAVNPDEIVLTFEDDGAPFDPRTQARAPEPASLAEAPVGGLGLVLVKKISSRMTYDRTSAHHNVLTLAIPSR